MASRPTYAAALKYGDGSVRDDARLASLFASIISQRNPDESPWADGPQVSFALELSVANAGVAVGNANELPEAPTWISLVSDKDVFFAKTVLLVGTPADGSQDSRHFAVAGERRILPWGETGFFILNAVIAEKPNVRVEGWI